MVDFREQGRRRARLTATVAAVLLGGTGAVAVGLGLSAQDPPPPAPPQGTAAAPQASTAAPSPEESTKPQPAADPDGSARQQADRPDRPVIELDYSVPVQISIPEIGVSSSLLELGLDSSGAMETPQPPHVDQAGWFRPSPPPGIPGATVIAGHVTWNQEPEVFFRLGDLRKGDTVRVRRADGATTVFEVYRIGSFPKDGFPTDAVYNQPDRSELRLITCGGEYDAQAHRYLANVIVWARIVRVDRAGA